MAESLPGGTEGLNLRIAQLVDRLEAATEQIAELELEMKACTHVVDTGADGAQTSVAKYQAKLAHRDKQLEDLGDAYDRLQCRIRARYVPSRLPSTRSPQCITQLTHVSQRR